MGRLHLPAVASALLILSTPSVADLNSGRLPVTPASTPAPAAHDLRRQATGTSSSSIVTLHLPDFEDQTILASVITADPTATSYLLACPTDEPDDECGLGTGIRVLEGASTLEVHMTLDGYTDDVSCSLSGDAADCNRSARNTAGITIMDVHYEGISTWAMPVTVTAGLETPTSAPAAGGSESISSSTSASGGSSTSSSGVSSATTTSGSAPAPTGTGAAAQSSSTSTDGVAAVTLNAVAAGVAAVLGAMLLA